MTNFGKQSRVTYEIGFVVNVNRAGEKYYIQSALRLDDKTKREQEIRPFLKLRNDFTKRIVITRTMMPAWTDEYGIRYRGMIFF